MTDESTGDGRVRERDDGWTTPLPDSVPDPTYWPAALALGMTVLAWGLVTQPLVAAVGGVVAVGSLGGWIRRWLRDG